MDTALFVTVVVVFSVYESSNNNNKNNKKRKNEDSSLEESLLDALRDGTSRDSKEQICTVDKDNIPTPNGHPRSQMRLENLWHRATYILVRHATTVGSNSQTGEGSCDGSSTILVQRRSTLKDYCPGKLDPTPGGVVGFGESCQLNAEREIQEEMGIDVSSDNPFGSKMERLFSFPYEDAKVKVWGEFFELQYNGPIDGLKIQKEEVDEVIPVSTNELKLWLEEKPDEFMPDACHAMRLYFQRKTDMKLKRKLLHGYSSGNLDRYGLRPKPQVIFIDCDDTLYFDNWKTAKVLTASIQSWCAKNLGFPPGKDYELYKKYGTALRGMLEEGYIENTPEAIDKFLEEVHDIPISELLQPDPTLREILLKMDPTIPKYIFTASVSHHAERCIKALGIEDLFEKTIIDVKKCNLQTKHSPESFRAAMEIANVHEPEACIFLDDSVKNIHAARKIGWRSVLVGKVGRDTNAAITSDHAELEIDRIHDIESVLPEIF